MTTNELIALFRTDTADIEVPYLWTDAEVLTYLNDAYTMLVRFLGGASDSTSGFCTVPFSASAVSIAVDPSILRIVRAFRLSDKKEISVIEDTDAPLVRDSAGNLALLQVGSTTGPVEFLIVGRDASTARLHPIPLAGDSLVLHVRRLPVTALTAGVGQPSDLRAEHHLHLLKWMKAAAYRKQDAETADPGKAQENESLFLNYCAQAVHEQERMRRKSRTSLRSERDMKNPLLTGNSYRQYEESARSSRRPRQQQEE